MQLDYIPIPHTIFTPKHLQILYGYICFNPQFMYKIFFQPADEFNVKAAPIIQTWKPKFV
jgi:hypothetical protein